MVKSREKKVTNVEAQLLKTAAKQALGGGSGGKKGEGESGTSPVMTYKDKDEQMLRDKLVNKLKEKEVNSSKFLHYYCPKKVMEERWSKVGSWLFNGNLSFL